MFKQQRNNGILQRICLWLKPFCQSKWFIFWGTVVLVCMIVLTIRSSYFPVDTPDGLLIYDADHLEQFFCGKGKALRWLYVLTQVSFDSALPLAYGMLLGMLIVKYYPISQASRWIVFPLLAVACDFSENTLLVVLANTWDCEAEIYPALASVAPYVSRAKWLMILVSVAAVVIGWLNSKQVPDLG